MRFRYFDSEGTEVELSSVDALKFRMSTGAITPETLLYDAAVGKWAPAGRHQVYRFLVEEEDDLLPEASRAMWKEMEDEEPVAFTSDPGEARSERDPELPSNPDRRKRRSGPGGTSEPAAPDPDSPRPEPDLPSDFDVSALPGPELPSDPDRRKRTSRPSRKEEVRSPEREEEENGKAPAKQEEDLADLDRIEPLAETEEVDSAEPAPTKHPPGSAVPEVTDSTAQDESAEPNQLTRRPSSHPRIREVDIPVRLVSRTTATDDSGSESTGSRSGGSRRMRWSVLAALLLFGGGAVLVHLTETRPDVLAAGATDTTVERTGPMSSVASMVAGDASGAAVHRAGAGSGEERAQPSAGEEMESLVSEVAGAVSLDLARAMSELQEALGVTERPPEAWLHGAYLAGADRHPQVRAYWRAYRAYVTSVRALEEELYRGFVQNRVLKMGLDTASAAGLSARILERYERSAEKREAVYADLAALAGEALALHDTLADRSESISYEPFSGRSLSRDPVVEAIADDPELAEHIWSRMDRIFELLDRIQGVQPVSTLRLQDALLSGLRVPEREG